LNKTLNNKSFKDKTQKIIKLYKKNQKTDWFGHKRKNILEVADKKLIEILGKERFNRGKKKPENQTNLNIKVNPMLAKSIMA